MGKAKKKNGAKNGTKDEDATGTVKTLQKTAEHTSDPASVQQQPGKSEFILPGDSPQPHSEKHIETSQRPESASGVTTESSVGTVTGSATGSIETADAIESSANPSPQPANYTESDNTSKPESESQEGSSDGVPSPEAFRELQSRLIAAESRAEAAEMERDESQERYDNLLEKVSHIKATLGTRLKADAETLASCQAELEKTREERDALRKEAESQKMLLDQNAVEDQSNRDALETRLAKLEEDASAERQAARRYMQLTEDLEAKLAATTASKSASESTLLRELEAVRLASKQTDHAHQETQQALEALRAEFEKLEHSSAEFNATRTRMEQEVRERTLLIGKLRHEAVVLNDHLTNALRLVKKDAEGQTVDKELISNLFVQFATVPRQDTKKFEILQLIANFLDWDEDRRTQVGLSRGLMPSSNEKPSLGGVIGKFAEFLERESRRK